jgi:NADPH:quinone reductase-like Zn-dependent oxidoreductase
MKAIIVREFGAPEVLRLEEASDLQPAENQVLVRVKAARAETETALYAGQGRGGNRRSRRRKRFEF